MRRATGRRTFGCVLAAALAVLAALPAAAATSATLEFFAAAAVPASVPQPITDLVAFTTAPLEGRISLTWTAPDAYTPPEGESVSRYTVKYATFSVDQLGGNTTSWWNTATFTATVPGTPRPPGSLESLILDRLEPGNTLYFAIRSTNSVASQLSPIDSNASTLLPTPPQAAAAVPNLPPPPPVFGTFTPYCGRIQTVWSPLDTGVTYDFDRYRLFQSSQTIGSGYVDISGPIANEFLQLSTGTTATGVLTEKNLVNFVTYYYQVLAYDRAGTPSVTPSTAIVSTQPYAVPTSATAMDVLGSSVTPSLGASWNNPALDAFKNGILVRTQGGPLNTLPVDFSTYSANSTLGNGTVLAAWDSAANQFQYFDFNLAGGATYYYYVFNYYKEGAAVCWSNAASDSIALQPKPMAPAGVTYVPVDNLNPFPKITWSKVEYYDTGVPMTLIGGYPSPADLDGYNVYASTCSAAGCGGATPWTKLNVGAVVSKTLTTFTLTGTPDVKTWYIVRAANSFAFESADSNTVDSDRNLYAVAKLGDAMVAQAVLPLALKQELAAAINGLGVDLTLSIQLLEAQPGVSLRSIEVRVLRGDNGQAVSGFAFRNGTTQLSISASADGIRALGARASEARPAQNSNLDIYWFNGVRYLPMNGDVDSQTETVTVKTSLTGKYQLRGVSRAQAFSFDPAQDLLPRVITPNGDGLNDTMFFNTKVDGVTGKVFDMRGAKVADLKACPGRSNPFNDKCLFWDGKASNKAVHSGIYLYDLNGQGTHFTGTVVVAN